MKKRKYWGGQTSSGATETRNNKPPPLVSAPPLKRAKQEATFCSDCGITCPNEEALREHFNGKRHQALIAQRKQVGNGVANSPTRLVSDYDCAFQFQV